MRKIPIWIQDFKKLIDWNYLYIDKTQDIINLVNQNSYYFLPRPRRFWKSLLCSTMKYLFLAEKSLFNWLYAENNRNWNTWYPIVYISFAWWWSKDNILNYVLKYWYIFIKNNNQIKQFSIQDFISKDNFTRLSDIVNLLYNKFNKQVVIIVDEYDRPVLNILHKVDEAEILREKFRDFYSWIKDVDSQVRLFFLTWITKILKMSIFSVLNNLEDLFYDPRAYKIVWYTENELNTYFSEELEEVRQFNNLWKEELKNVMKSYYNWFNFWNPNDKIYNPWDINNLMLKKMFGMYWSQTWLPSSIEEYIKAKWIDINDIIQRIYSNELVINEIELNLENLHTISAEVLLLTSGYLTVIDKQMTELLVWFPNKQTEIVVSNYFSKLIYWPEKSIGFIQLSKTLLKGIKNLDKDLIKKWVLTILDYVNNVSYERIARNPEWWLKTLIMLTLNLSVDFSISEKHFISWRNDIFLLINWKKYILEVKVDTSLEELKKQLKTYRNQADVLIWILWDRKKKEIWVEII